MAAFVILCKFGVQVCTKIQVDLSHFSNYIYIMNKETLRQEVHQLVDQLRTTSRLKAWKELLEQEVQSKGDFWDELTNEQKADVMEGIAQSDRGEVKPYKEVKKMMRKRYNL